MFCQIINPMIVDLNSIIYSYTTSQEMVPLSPDKYESESIYFPNNVIFDIVAIFQKIVPLTPN